MSNKFKVMTAKELAKEYERQLKEQDIKDGVKRTRWQRFKNWINGTPYRRYD